LGIMETGVTKGRGDFAATDYHVQKEAMRVDLICFGHERKQIKSKVQVIFYLMWGRLRVKKGGVFQKRRRLKKRSTKKRPPEGKYLPEHRLKGVRAEKKGQENHALARSGKAKKNEEMP